ncbi:MAG: SRPBCC domain-containing protein [Acidimicrobiales bacterium]|nr:SRPBCC domain-containing protein [Acidimicrobiales bacterium]
MTDPNRSLEFEIEVNGTPEEVWAAIATGPGISSWYVPHTVEEKQDGKAVARFGAGPEMEVPGRVAVWDPPHRIVFDGGKADEGLAFEWLVESRDGGTCIVRLVNTGFGSGDEWDAQYDGMAEGWRMFLRNLQLHLEHFRGQRATPALPMCTLPNTKDHAWEQLTKALGIAAQPELGQRVELSPENSELLLAGKVIEVAPHRLTLLIDQPAPGTAFIAAEGYGDQTGLSVWSYLYGPEGAAAQSRDEHKWQEWLEGLA